MAKKTSKKAATKLHSRDEKEAAVEAVRETLHQRCKDMSPADFREVLETVQADIEAHLEALAEESE